MILIITALMIEASPVIEHFKLKRDMFEYTYPIFRNQEITLIISGTGKLKSAIAATYLLSTCKAGRKTILINIGFCGTNSTLYDRGSLLAVSKITDMDTGMDYYSDILWEKPLPQVTLCCYSKLLRKEDLQLTTDIFCDMESAGIMEASKKFTYSHQVVILKIISDNLCPENLDKKLLQSYVSIHMDRLEVVIDEIKRLDSLNEISFATEFELVNSLSKDLRFTQAMKQLLLKEIRKAKLKRLQPLEILKTALEIKVDSKIESKRVFKKIIGDLNQKNA